MSYPDPKVLIVMRGDTLFGGGAERRFWRLYQYVRKSGHNVHLLTNKRLLYSLENGITPGEDEEALEPDCDANLHVFDDVAGGALENVIKLNLYAIRRIRSLHPAVVHLVLIQRSLIPLYLWLWTQRSMRVVATMAFSPLAYLSRVPFCVKLTAWLIWERADIIDSLYAEFVKTVSRRYQHKISISPCSFTDTEKFRPAAQKENLILFAGRLIEEKNPMLLVKALILLKQKMPHILDGWRVVILGDGFLEQELRNQIVQNELETVVSIERVHCTSEYMQVARIFVSLQRTENYPSQSLLEAMASGCAVIATDVGETRRLVDGETGLLIPNDSPVYLAQTLADLMASYDRCAGLGRRARERVLRDHTIARFSEYAIRLWRE